MRFLCALLLLFMPFGTVAAEDNSFKVIVPSCVIYQEADFASEQVAVLSRGDVVTKSGEEGDFFLVEASEWKGYVYKFYLCNAGVVDRQDYPVFDAKITGDCDVYSLDEGEVICKIKKGTEVCLYQGFDKNVGRLAICFVDEGGNVMFGKVDRKNVSPFGVSAGLITGIVVIISCVTIALLLVLMKKKKVGSKT